MNAIERKTGTDGKTYQVCDGTWYDARTPKAVILALERARARNARVRIFYGEPETGKSWSEENDVVGTIGRSMGPIKIPLLIHNSRSTGGPGILDHCIVRIQGSAHLVTYTHPKFDAGQWDIGDPKQEDHPGLLYVAGVYHNGSLHARFTSHEGAKRYREFMLGNRMAK